MKRIPFSILFAFPLVLASAAGARLTILFDADWRFLNADAPGAEQPQFDDSAWRKLNVPHDWSIEGPFSQTNKTGGAGAFLPSGAGWYRKHFTVPTNSDGKLLRVEFDVNQMYRAISFCKRQFFLLRGSP